MARYRRYSRKNRIPQSVIARERERAKKISEAYDAAQKAVLAGYPEDCAQAIIDATHTRQSACDQVKFAKCYYKIQPNGTWLWAHEYAREWWEREMKEAETIYREYQSMKVRICETYGIHPDKVVELIKAITIAEDEVFHKR